ncbi:MAG: AI-2E family transporter [Holophagaceae bacterium]|uniref:AI-2E family transporter n=1 Tax=Candidatus Geothrix skivensis TaxID=2954439 RepID=A0A9D7XJG9_9BACT|nr:AI-2E family transporter [Candidatus Geothrix skivensis]
MDRGPRTVRFEIPSSTLVRLLLVGASLWLVMRLWPVILVFVVALLIMETLNPAVQWLEARRVRRLLGIFFVFSGVFLLAVLILTLSIPSVVAQAAVLLEREPVLRASVADYLSHYHLSAPFAEWLRNLKYGAPGNTVGATAFAYSLRIFEIGAYGLSAIFLALYMMIDRDRLRGGLYALVPRTHHLRLSRVMLNVETIVGAYIRGQLVTCLLIGAFTFVLLTACGVENAMALAVFAGIADVLPYIGAILSVVPVFIAALGHGTTTGIVVLVAMLAYEEFESRVLIPQVYGKALRLPSSVVFFALMVGGTLMGLLGALLALPIAATIMMLIEELRVDLPGEQAQVADTELRARDDLGEEEYERRTLGIAAEQAAAIAVEISVDRRNQDLHPGVSP